MSQQESLEQKTLRVFDELVLTGDVVFSHAPPSIIPSTPFNVCLPPGNGANFYTDERIDSVARCQQPNKKAAGRHQTSTAAAAAE